MTNNLKESYYHLYQETVLLKIIYMYIRLKGWNFFYAWLENFLISKKLHADIYYGFLAAVSVFLWDCRQRCLYDNDVYRRKLPYTIIQNQTPKL